MAEFRVRFLDNTAVTAYLRRYADARREIATAKKRLERLEYLAAKDSRYMGGFVREAIEEDRRRITERIVASERVKAEVREVIESLPPGDERRVLELCYIAEQNLQQVADTMHYSQRSVSNLKERGLKALIKSYGGDCKNGNEQTQNHSEDCKT